MPDQPVTPAPNSLCFYLNGERREILKPNPHILLTDYLRSPEIGLTGTKVPCGVGQCGGCTVVVSDWNDENKTIHHKAVNACLHPIGLLDGKSVTTVEGIGSVETSLNPVQYRLVEFNGSQCGMCSPGFVMSMQAYLCQNEEDTWTAESIEAHFDNNLCRCTGYRSILSAMKSFARDDDSKAMRCKPDPSYADLKVDQDPRGIHFPEALKIPPRHLHIISPDGREWIRPTNLEGLQTILSGLGNSPMRYISGHTTSAFHDIATEGASIVITELRDLSTVVDLNDKVLVGGIVTYRHLINDANIYNSAEEHPFSNYAMVREMALQTAGSSIRDQASVAGNLVWQIQAQQTDYPFVSDMVTVLVAIGASLKLLGDATDYPVLDVITDPLYWNTKLNTSLIESITLPKSGSDSYGKTYNVALRRQMAFSIVNAGIRMQFDQEKRISNPVIVFGGLSALPFRATTTEQFLDGKPWSIATFDQAVVALGKELQVPYGLEAVKIHFAQSFLYKYFVEVSLEISPNLIPPSLRSVLPPPPAVSSGRQTYTLNKTLAPVGEPYMKDSGYIQATGQAIYAPDVPVEVNGGYGALLLSQVGYGTYHFQWNETKVSLERLTELLQAKFPDLQYIYTAKDIPGSNHNGLGVGWWDTVFAPDDKVFWYGQAMALVVAKHSNAAQEIVDYMHAHCIVYAVIDDPNYAPAGSKYPYLFPPVYSLKAAMKHPKRKMPEPPSYYYNIPGGVITRPGSNFDWEKAKQTVEVAGVQCKVVHGEQLSGMQAHFYMEPQSALAHMPQEGRLSIISASQSPRVVQQTASHVTYIPGNIINVSTKRLGGGFGGKVTRAPFVAMPATIGALQSKRGVKLVNLRPTDTAINGKRADVLGRYNIAIGDGSDKPENRGLIMGADTQYSFNGGFTYDLSFYIRDFAILMADNSYNIQMFRALGDVWQTNIAPTTSMRGFGVLESILIQEDMVEKAAWSIGMLPEDVRQKNLYHRTDSTPYGQKLMHCYIREMWDALRKNSDFDARLKAVEKFNKENRWRKRGIATVPVKFGVGFNVAYLAQGTALVNVYYQDGTVLVQQGGTEMGQGLNTQMRQIAAEALNIPMNLIAITDAATETLPNTTGTYASTGTSLNGAAVQDACLALAQRLKDFVQEMRKEMGDKWCEQQNLNYWSYKDGWAHKIKTPYGSSLVWNQIVRMAYYSRIDLSTKGFAKQNGLAPLPEIEQFAGFTYSAGCTEVELDVLTGETTVLRADLMYDVGLSVNAAIDIGQVEGGYVMGLGYVFSEEVVFEDGKLMTSNFDNYKVPSAGSIPLELNVELFSRDSVKEAADNPNLFMRNKGPGDPTIVLAVSAYCALKRAIIASRTERGLTGWAELSTPCTPPKVLEALKLDAKELNFSDS